MYDIIRLLPDSLANQIAAGEVVQRPASAVKELLENAVDAGSTEIILTVKEAGKTLIQVVDNGSGMSETDARMSFERHATSKIKNVDDLFRIRTMGYRGEALASIAAVAHVEMKTRKADNDMGTIIRIAGSHIEKQEPTACAVGTSIAIKNLFYNIPARRNFLKSNSVELKHIIDEFQRVALANPEVSFSFYQGDLEIYNLKGGKLANRIIGIFGKTYREKLIPCQEDISDLVVHGYIGKPETAKKTRGEQFFFVNNRFVRHPYLHHALMAAYEALLPAETFPFYVLFIDISPEKIDVNVHPTKTEIKFEDERSAYAVILACVRKALGTNHLAPVIDFSLDTNFMLPGRLKYEEDNEFDKLSDSEKSMASSYMPRKNTNWQSLYEVGFMGKNAALSTTPAEDINFDTLTIESAAGNQNALFDASEPSNQAQNLFQLHNTYLIGQVKSGAMLIEQQAASERILYERFLSRLHIGAEKMPSQQLLFWQTITLNAADFVIFLDISLEIQQLGFEIENNEKTTQITVKGIPTNMTEGNLLQTIENLIEQYKYYRAELKTGKQESLALTMAKRFSLKNGTLLSPDERQVLIDELFLCSNPNYSPSGKKIIVLLNLEQIAALF